MIQEAEEFAKEDLELKERIESKNNLEGLVYQTRSMIDKEDTKSKLESDDISTVTSLLDEVDEWLLNDDRSKSDYENKLNEVNGQLQPIMMKAMSQGPGGSSTEEAVPPPEEFMGPGPTIDEVD